MNNDVEWSGAHDDDDDDDDDDDVIAVDGGGRVGAVHGGVVRGGQERVRGVHLRPAVPHPLPRLG